jgi:nicotinate-nucleotide pyrophosphorylase (carboxylating)
MSFRSTIIVIVHFHILSYSMIMTDGIKTDDYILLIDRAIEEDLGKTGDVTSDAIFTRETGSARLISKDTGILAGARVFIDVFKRIDSETEVVFRFEDGDKLKPSDDVASVTGKIGSILKAERTALNFISFLSGIATNTAQYVEAAQTTGKATILDTRKTLPGFRELSKYAVREGGGHNHRIGLFDMVLIKDNHIDGAGGITKAVGRVRSKWGGKFTIEVECRTLDEVAEACECNVDIVMLDNMNDEQVREAVQTVSGRVKLEASGQMDLEKVRRMSSLGVDYISIGGLTKSVTAFDFSLDIG